MERNNFIPTPDGLGKFHSAIADLQVIVDAVPVLIWTSNDAKEFNYFNSTWLKFTGRKLEDELNNGWLHSIHTADINSFTYTYEQAFEKREAFKIQYRLLRHDGEYRWILNNGLPQFDDHQFIGYTGCCSDISELIETEQRKDLFMSIASHELKTPVTTTKIYLHILEEYFKKQGDEQQLIFAEKAGNQLDKLSKLINDMLDLSRINSNQLEFDEHDIEYVNLLEEVIEEFKKIYPSHLIKFSGEGSITVCGDKERLSQAIMNLLNNAVKFSPDSREIEVSLSSSPGAVETSIKDYGIGIQKKHHAKIFDRFYMMSGHKKHTYPGLGIGLYIAAEIIKRHGGNIWVTSEEGKETIFTFALPTRKIKYYV